MKKKYYWFLLLVLGFIFVSCATTSGDTETYQEIESLKKIESDLFYNQFKPGTKWVVNTRLGWYNNSLCINNGGYVGESLKYNAEQYPLLKEQIESGKDYTVYVTVISEGGLALFNNEILFYHVDKIEGLEEPEVIAARKQEEETAMRKKYWAKANPDNYDLSQYEETTSEDFSFDMVAGNLPVGAKVGFNAVFFIKPTGTSYKFNAVDFALTLNSRHNFVKELSAWNFEPDPMFNIQSAVFVYVTVLKSGQFGECSIDALHWDSEFNGTWGEF
jgi:hypothetical protein